jgi:hypothetical protein
MVVVSACSQAAPERQSDEPATQNAVTVTETVVSPIGGGADHPANAATAGMESSAAPAEEAVADEIAPFPMPDETGKVLQDAQDHLQQVSGNPFFVSFSTDATGAGRMQVIDRNWKVCDQSVPPGTLVDENTDITFSTVKTGEDCP